MTLLLRAAACVFALAFAASAAHAQQPQDEEPDTDAPAASALPGETLPPNDLSPEVLYGFLVAEIALQRGNDGLAAQTMVDLARKTRDPRLARRAVEVANNARIPSLALEAARTWYDGSPESQQALQALTVLLIGARKVGEAEPYLEKLLSRDGAAAASGFMQLGRLLAGNPDKGENLKVIERIAQKYPDLSQARFAVAQAALAAGEEDTALREIRRAAAVRPDWELAALFEARVLQRSQPDAAAARLAEFLKQFPQSREVRLNYARALVGDRKYPEARGEFEKLIAANPTNAELLHAVALLAVQTKDYAIAEANLKRALGAGHRDPNAVRYALGQIAEETKEFGKARDWYQGIGRGEHFVPSRMRYAQTLSKEGKLEEARNYLRTQDSAGEQRHQFIIGEAQLLRDAGKNADAYEVLGQALAKSPEQPDLLYDHALTAEKLDRFDVLEANLRKLIQMQPGHAHAYNALGYSLADRNQRLDEAKKLIEKALELSPEDHAIVDSMGWVLFRMGDTKGALEYLRRAFRGRPDGEIAAHLGEVLWTSGEREEAERIWNETLKNHPNDDVLQKTIRRLKK
ncbi:MAG: tetratricopeptide repeat protein [Betaproteobacteria bacterium]|nr:tetratricopeptide repeat protein [Betaproteobacteria bacterium]